MRRIVACFFLAFAARAQTISIGPCIFFGTGLNDAACGGRYTASPNARYFVTISATGAPDHFKWSKNGGALSAAIAITGKTQAIADGVTVSFRSTTGHTRNDSWTIAATANGSVSGYTFAQQGIGALTARNAQDKLRETVSVEDFGAKGDNVADDTAAIQACIDNSANNRVSCFIPPGIYKITGSGLHIYAGQPSLYGLENEGSGSPALVYYGTGTALTIGDGAHIIYAVNLRNIVITAANGVTPQYGIDARILSGGVWDGVTVGGSMTSGTFTGANIRFSDSGFIDLRNPLITNLAYTPGTTGILFDEYGIYGNYNITISGSTSQMFALQYDFNFKSCINCIFRDGFSESFDYDSFIDNKTAWSPNSGMTNILFDGWDFLGNGPATHHKVLQVNSTAGNPLLVDNFVYRSCRWYFPGEVVYPAELNIPSTGANSKLSLKFDTNYMIGVGAAIVDSDSTLANIRFTGENAVYDRGTTGPRPADVHGAANVIDYSPANAVGQKLNWVDPSGAQFLAGASSNAMARPEAGFSGPGVVAGADVVTHAGDDGFLRLEAGGGTSASQKVFCDFSGSSLVTDMNRNIVCFVGGAEVTRQDGNGFAIGGGTSIRKYSTVSVPLDFPAPPSVPGCTPRLRLAVAGTVAASAPLFYSPPVLVPTAMTFSAWTGPDGAIDAQWCQFSGTPTDPDGAGATYTVSVIQ
jgi:hypothetical protein